MYFQHWSLGILLLKLVSAEVASNYALLIPTVKDANPRYYNGGGSGYNGGGGYGYSSGGSGYNSGVTGGSGYNPGYSGSASGAIAFSATRADPCCRRTFSRLKFERSVTNLGGAIDQVRRVSVT